ncbi:MAG: lysoplasmalogenase family protein [Candidatus Onthovivens sp.]|nr:lysoplasmalogenase family protein [Candidatus Onthovivens sp.]
MDSREVILLSFSIFFFLVSSLEVYFCHKKKEKERKIIKCLPLLLLDVCAIILYPTDPLIYCAFIAGTIGDAFLISMDKKMFAVGTIFFFIDHILIATKIFLYSKITFMYPFYLMLAGGLILVVFFGIIFLKKYMSYFFVIENSSYLFMLLLNLIASIGFAIVTNNNYFYILFVAYFIFILSDMNVGIKRFVVKFKGQQVFIMFTYYLAQYLIFLTFFLL